MAKSSTYNESSFKAFKSKLDRVSELRTRVSQGKMSTRQKLATKLASGQQKKEVQPTNNQKASDAKLAALDKKYKKQIGSIEEGFNEKMKSLSDKNEALSKSLNKGFNATNRSFSDFTNRVQSILAKKEEEGKSTGETTTKPETTDLESIQDSFNVSNPYDIKIDESKDTDEDTPETDVSTVDTEETENKKEEVPNTEGTNLNGFVFLNPAETDVAAQSENNKKIDFKIGADVPVGDYTYKITNLHGERSGDNAVLGRSGHSKGVDLVSYKDGKKVNYPVAIADGVIVGIGLDGSGKAIKTTQGKAAGYMVYVQLAEDPSKVIGYWHVGKSVKDNETSLLGATVKRGDVLVEDASWTGSGTGPHTKIVMSSWDNNRKSHKVIGDYKDNDPTNLILTGKVAG